MAIVVAMPCDITYVCIVVEFAMCWIFVSSGFNNANGVEAYNKGK